VAIILSVLDVFGEHPPSDVLFHLDLSRFVFLMDSGMERISGCLESGRRRGRWMLVSRPLICVQFVCQTGFGTQSFQQVRLAVKD
jgi:hypothetical protein